MKNRNDFIRKIPDYLSLSRLIFAPVIIILGLTKHFIPIIILIILAALTDFLDGYLAKKWLVQSKKGMKLDIVVSKIFIISLILSLAFQFHLLWIPLLLEIAIAFSNLYYFSKNQKIEVLTIGKVKTSILFLLILVSFLCMFTNLPIRLWNAFIYASINIQILALISYFIQYQDYCYELKNKEQMKKRNQRMDDLENKTIMLDKIEDLLKDYEKKDIL